MGSDGEAHELVPQADDHSQPKDLSEEMFRAFSMSMEHERVLPPLCPPVPSERTTTACARGAADSPSVALRLPDL